MSDVTRLLSAIEQGDPRASEELLPLVYRELRRLARHRLDRERPGQTLQATALVHEAYLRLVDGEEAQRWNSCNHFLAAAGEAMRRILVENARRKQAEKHGGGMERQDLDGIDIEAPAPSDDLLALDEALKKLEAEDSVKAQLVKLRYFAGLSEEEAASVLGLSRTSVQRYWRYTKAWLFIELRGAEAREKNPGNSVHP
ncbi:sigma-70 family RNA polymerase sigma factor [Paludisphaera soli]|uniref:sigma-70 family RNA polymerase sigma factor n=1 Tax=Paludisphaera soli TaxID=2712865 RepID=UPI0013EB4222|nr:sigma-70 family RNA polymerase sigma factor [Paludisphaera soli]